jgi:threonine dehydrogenase-like Zn-dependent dehydrogenase
LNSTSEIAFIPDLVIECTGAPGVMSEGLGMLRLGGSYIIEGAFVEGPATEISVSRQVVAKNARIIGVAGMPYQGYGRVLKLMAHFRNSILFAQAVTHQFGVESAEEALMRSIAPDSMKVVITPNRE